ncbi:ribonuclease Z, mitochondrial isoform X1 [Diorhabda carinulata]|uniref:ribonuclease Z, mitochondrial isoform X1 n=1 Tax=Diorhabda carinulata TaxID=1163345 RepID=UPI0025A14B5D|nr:ribonuclease Z, mitochondrial isoform X1 [Diorhabda carinulata]
MFYIFKRLHFIQISYSIARYSQNSHSKLLSLLKDMPKDPTHILTVQKQRKKIKEKLSRYVPGKVTLQVLGTGARGAPRALYVFSDQSRYLFNCGEGTQRLAHEHKMKLAKLEHIFITQPVWQNIGGLPGLALTIQDVGVPDITLHGPPGLDEIFYATKRFVVLRDLKIHMAECTEENIFEDNVMMVKYVPLTRNAEDLDNHLLESSEEEPEVVLKNTGIEAVVDQMDASTSTRRERSRGKRRHSKSSRNNSRSNSLDTFEDNIDYYAHERKKNRKPKNCSRNHSRSRSLSSDSGLRVPPIQNSLHSREVLEKTKEMGVSMAYVCKLQPRPGALNLDKCVQMGITPGPILGKLKAGEDVVLSNGNIVRSQDVCEPDDPGLIFIVVDCSTIDYLESLNNNETIKKHQKYSDDENEIANLIVHFSPKEVVEDSRYQEWMDNFPASTTHLMLNECNDCMGSEAVHRIQYKLNLLSDNIFPLLGDKGTTVLKKSNESGSDCKKQKIGDVLEDLQNNLNTTKLSENTKPITPLFICPDTFCAYHLRPKKGLDKTMELKLDPVEYIDETFNVADFKNTLSILKQTLKSKKITNEEFPKMLFLGTGSCIPNKTRNTSGILLSLNEDQNILLDCGEGTYGQIIRFFGPEAALKVLANIDAIYISHLHADHHIGLIGVLQGRKQAIEELKLEKDPCFLFAPKQIMAWLYFYDKYFENIRSEFELIANGDLDLNNPLYKEQSRILRRLNLQDIKTCLVRHCPNAFGVSVTSKNGVKLTYSGDTMPSENLVKLGEDSDILIHEATMEDELAQEAIIKMHSTTSQAIEIGNRMNAKNIILTHFSQRYAKLPRFNDKFGDNVGIAFDNMKVSLSDLSLLPELIPALKLMFAEHCEELETKAVKRQMRIEREKQTNDSLKRKEIET